MNRFALTLAITMLLPLSGVALHAQAAPAAAIAPPVLPLMTSYSYWPIQFVQFVGAELPYSMIALDVDPGAGKSPLVYVTLTDRATGKRIHYASDDGLIAAAVAQGEEAHKTAIAYEAADDEKVGSVSSVRFTMADGQPLQWRFVQGSEISEQGSGVNPFPEAKIPIFAYREMGALAGEGTALQIGDTVSTAEVWAQYSHPPYFVGYHGAETEGAHTLVFIPGREIWSVVSAPSALVAGSTWELDGDHGDHRSIHIDKVDGAHLTVTAVDSLWPGVRCLLDVTRTGETWSFDRVRFSPVRDGEKHTLTLQFATPLSSAANHVGVAVIAGRKKTIASGEVAASADGSQTLTLSFASPSWLGGKKMSEQSVSAKNSIVLTAHP